jgi:hypothetical protein
MVGGTNIALLMVYMTLVTLYSIFKLSAISTFLWVVVVMVEGVEGVRRRRGCKLVSRRRVVGSEVELGRLVVGIGRGLYTPPHIPQKSKWILSRLFSGCFTTQFRSPSPSQSEQNPCGIVFEGLVWSGFFPFWNQTRTATSSTTF